MNAHVYLKVLVRWSLVIMLLAGLAACGKSPGPEPETKAPAPPQAQAQDTKTPVPTAPDPALLDDDDRLCLWLLWSSDLSVIKSAQEALSKGESFVVLARKLSETQPDVVSVNADCARTGSLDPAMADAAEDLPLGGVSAPFTYQKGTALVMRTTDRYRRKGRKLYSQGKYAQAEDALLADLKLHPVSSNTLHLLALARTAQGNLKGALRALNQALLWSPNDPGLLNDKASTLVTLGKKGQALPLFERALKLGPNNPMIMGNLAWALTLNHKDLKRAESLARRAVQLEPGAPELWNTLGLVQQARGDHASAVVSLHKAARLDPRATETQKRLLETMMSLDSSTVARLFGQPQVPMRQERNLGRQMPLPPEVEARAALEETLAQPLSPPLAQPEPKPEAKLKPEPKHQAAPEPKPKLAESAQPTAQPAAKQVVQPKPAPMVKAQAKPRPEPKPAALVPAADKPQDKAQPVAMATAQPQSPPKPAPAPKSETQLATKFQAPQGSQFSQTSKTMPMPEPAPALAPQAQAAPQPQAKPVAKPAPAPAPAPAAPPMPVAAPQPQASPAPVQAAKPETTAGDSEAPGASAMVQFLQIGTYRSLAQAKKASKDWSKLGLEVHLEPWADKKGTAWHRVMLGPYRDKAEALGIARALRKSGHIKSYRRTQREIAAALPPEKVFLQVASFRSKKRSSREESRWKKMGYPTQRETWQSTSGKVWHRVLLGPYPGITQALELGIKLSRQKRSAGFRIITRP